MRPTDTDEARERVYEAPAPGPATAPEAEDRPEVPTACLTVLRSVIFQPAAGQAQEIVTHREGYFDRHLYGTRQQPWKRSGVRVGERWTPLRLGWITEEDPHPPSLVSVVNDEGFFQFIPTPEARAEVMARVVEVGAKTPGLSVPLPFAEVPPLENQPFRPVAGVEYFLRCRRGEASVTIAAVPGDGR